MNNRTTYTDFSAAIGVAIRDLDIPVADKRDCIIKAVSHIITGNTLKTQCMMIDHACRLAHVPFNRIEDALDPYYANKYPQR